MIVASVFYGLKCNRCGSMHENSDGYTYMMDEGQILEDALENEWAEKDGKHYCPNCYIPSEDEDSDEIVVKPTYPELIKKLEKFILNITKNVPRTVEGDDKFEISFYENHAVGLAEMNWITSFDEVCFQRIPARHSNQVILIINK